MWIQTLLSIREIKYSTDELRFSPWKFYWNIWNVDLIQSLISWSWKWILILEHQRRPLCYDSYDSYKKHLNLYVIPLINALGLDNNVSLCNFLGLPMMLVLRASLNFKTGTLTCPAIDKYFKSHMKFPGVGMISWAQFDKYSFTVTPIVTSNIPIYRVVLHYVIIYINSCYTNGSN